MSRHHLWASASYPAKLVRFIVVKKQTSTLRQQEDALANKTFWKQNPHTKLTVFNFLMIVLFRTTAIMHPMWKVVSL
jgi:hypothetical protein